MINIFYFCKLDSQSHFHPIRINQYRYTNEHIRKPKWGLYFTLLHSQKKNNSVFTKYQNKKLAAMYQYDIRQFTRMYLRSIVCRWFNIVLNVEYRKAWMKNTIVDLPAVEYEFIHVLRQSAFPLAMTWRNRSLIHG